MQINEAGSLGDVSPVTETEETKKEELELFARIQRAISWAFSLITDLFSDVFSKQTVTISSNVTFKLSHLWQLRSSSVSDRYHFGKVFSPREIKVQFFEEGISQDLHKMAERMGWQKWEAISWEEAVAPSKKLVILEGSFVEGFRSILCSGEDFEVVFTTEIADFDSMKEEAKAILQTL